MSDYIIEIHDLCKAYKRHMAVNHLEMNVKKGDIYGFIGYNGAGKSTTLKMICGLIKPTSGSVKLFGSDEESVFHQHRIGALIESAGLYPNLSAYENMNLKAIGMGLPDKHNITALLTLVGLQDVGKKRISQFSVGMKQRLGIALALLGNPDLLILDEPINGIDPQGVKDIRLIVEKLNHDYGMTIIISSHILGELSKIATTYGFIRDGEIIQQISAESLHEKCGDYLELCTDNPGKTITVLEAMGIYDFEVHDENTLFIYHVDDSSYISKALINEGIMLKQLHNHQQDLESYFLKLMGENNHV